MIFVLISIIILILLAVLVPKRISQIELYATCFFAYSFGITVDIIFDFMYDLYGYISEGPQFTGIIFVMAVYFSINTLYLNYFPFKKSLVSKILYIFAWSIFSICFEVIIVRTKMFYYNGWKWWYSCCLYPIIFTILVLNLLLVRKLLHIKNQT